MCFQILKIATFICLSPLLAVSADAATVALRSAGVANGPVLTLGDVADVQSSDPSEVVALATTPLGPAPQTRIFLRASEIRDLLTARGIDLRGIRFTGPDKVEIGRIVQSEGDEPIAKTHSNGTAVIAADVRDAIRNYLARQTGHDHWKIALVAGNANLDHLAGSRATIQIRGGTAPWTGRQSFEVRRPGVSPRIGSIRPRDAG